MTPLERYSFYQNCNSLETHFRRFARLKERIHTHESIINALREQALSIPLTQSRPILRAITREEKIIRENQQSLIQEKEDISKYAQTVLSQPIPIPSYLNTLLLKNIDALSSEEIYSFLSKKNDPNKKSFLATVKNVCIYIITLLTCSST